MNRIVLFIVLLAPSLVLATSNDSIEDISRDIARGAAAEAPQQVSKNMTVVAFVADGSVLNILIRLAYDREFLDQTLKQADLTIQDATTPMSNMAVNGACSDDLLALFIEAGGSLAFQYQLSDGARLATINVASCPADFVHQQVLGLGNNAAYIDHAKDRLMALLEHSIALEAAQAADDPYSIDYRVIQKLIDSVVANDRISIADMVAYPFNRRHPLPSIVDRNDFIARFDQVFDDELRQMIESSSSHNWNSVGYRGIMLGNGQLWMDYDGTIIAVNHHTKLEDSVIDLLNRSNDLRFHESVKSYESTILEAWTDGFRIRVDLLSDGTYQYASWSSGTSTHDEPDLILRGGSRVSDGSGGNHHYSFRNGAYEYNLHVAVLRKRKTDLGWVSVSNDGAPVLREPLKYLLK
tara:strand:- start:2406 stop:3632 length:1227 start_codon:yes stop_codon:yes gene_type:complete